MKNLVVYKLAEDYEMDFWTADFDKYKFTPCGPLNLSCIGFVHNVFKSYMETLSGGVVLLNICTQKKAPKKSHIQYIIDNKVQSLLDLTGSKPNGTELSNIEDDAFSEVLSKTFPNAPVELKVFVHPGLKLLFVEANSYKKGSEIVDLLGDLLGNPVSCTVPEFEAVDKFGKYLTDSIGDPFVLGSSAKLVDKDKRKMTLAKDDLLALAGELVSEKEAFVEQLEINYDGIMTFKVKTSLEFSGIKFDKEALSEVGEDVEGTTLLQVNEVVKMYTKFTKMLGEE